MLSLRRRYHPELSEAQANCASIWDIPESELPTGAAQLVLIALARLGWDIYAYRPVASRTHVLWLGPLAETRPDHNGRVSLEEWQRDYSALLVQMGYTAREGGATC